jgi:hypothetical protein
VGYQIWFVSEKFKEKSSFPPPPPDKKEVYEDEGEEGGEETDEDSDRKHKRKSDQAQTSKGQISGSSTGKSFTHRNLTPGMVDTERGVDPEHGD